MYTSNVRLVLAICAATVFSPIVSFAQVAETPEAPETPQLAGADKALLPYCQQLQPGATHEQWKHLWHLVEAAKAQAEQGLQSLPYESRKTMAQPKLCFAALDAKPGAASLWRESRRVSESALPSGGYIHTAAIVLNGNLTRGLTAAEKAGRADPRRRYNPNIAWDGYIHSSVVIASGEINITGQIYDSIVIARGPVKAGYIYNSLVISCYDGEQPAVDTSDGYISRSLVLAPTCKPGSARQCTIFAKVDGNDFRGAVTKPWSADLSKFLGAAQVELPAVARPKQPQPPGAAKLLETLLNTEQLTVAADVVDVLAEYRLQQSQVAQLIDAAKAATSDTRRNLLWHAVRLSRDHAGRTYLMEAVAQHATDAQKIMYLQTWTNPAPDDVPMLTAIYQHWAEGQMKKPVLPSSPPGADPTTELSDVGSAMMRFASRNWTDLVKEWDPPVALGYLENHDGNRIEERREGEAEHGQHLFLHWLIKYGVTADHKIQAYEDAMQPRGNWPRYVVTPEMRKRLTNDLIATSNEPDFRSRIVAVVAKQVDPIEFLNLEEDEQVRLAAIRVISKQAESAWTSYSTSRYTTVQRYLRAMKDVAQDEDEQPQVQTQAKRLVKRFERWLEEK